MTVGANESLAIAEHYAAAWNDHNLRAIISLHSADTRYQLHGRTGLVVGESATAAAFSVDLESVPDIHFELVTLHAGSDHAVFQSRITGTRAGHPVAIDGVDLLTFREGLVYTKDTYLG